MTKLLSDEELDKRVYGIIAAVTRSEDSSLGHLPKGEAADKVLAIINTQKRLYAESRLDELNASVGAIPEDIHNYNNELLGKWQERRRSLNLIEEQRARISK